MGLGQVPATDPQGMAGWTRHVTPHDGRRFGAIVIGGVRRGGTPAVMTEAAGAGPVGHAPALGRGRGGSPAATTAALGAVSGALIGAAMGAGAGLAVGTATAIRGRLGGLDVGQHASGTGIPRAVTAARIGPDSRGAGLDMPTLMVHQELRRRLDTLARRVGLSTTALGNLLLEAAVNAEERRLARDHRVVKELEDVLVRAILRGEYDPAVSGTDARSGRSDPPGEALESPAAAIPPGDARRSGQSPDGNTEGLSS